MKAAFALAALGLLGCVAASRSTAASPSTTRLDLSEWRRATTANDVTSAIMARCKALTVIEGVLSLAQDGAAVGLSKGTQFVSVWVPRTRGAS